MSALQFTLLGDPVRLARPEFLLGLGAALLLLALAAAAAWRRRRALERLFAPGTLPRAAPAASAGRFFARQALSATAVALFSIALAQPQCGTHRELAKRFGIDLVIALDASQSMLARDVKPSRLERAKIELSGLLDRLGGDRVGLVVFAGDAFTQCPLTSDYAAAKMFLRAISTQAMPLQGTDLARALEESRELLARSDRGAKARAIVLLTDGEHNAGARVEEEIEQLRALGVRVFAVGLGSTTGEPIPREDAAGNLLGYKKDRDGTTVMTKLDEAGLRALAERTGGQYVQSAGGVLGIESVAAELDRLDKAEFETRLTVKYDERFQLALLPGVLLLVAAAALRPARARRSAR